LLDRVFVSRKSARKESSRERERERERDEKMTSLTTEFCMTLQNGVEECWKVTDKSGENACLVKGQPMEGYAFNLLHTVVADSQAVSTIDNFWFAGELVPDNHGSCIQATAFKFELKGSCDSFSFEIYSYLNTEARCTGCSSILSTSTLPYAKAYQNLRQVTYVDDLNYSQTHCLGAAEIESPVASRSLYYYYYGDGNGLSTGASIGIAVGVFILFFFVLCLIRKQRLQSAAQMQAQAVARNAANPGAFAIPQTTIPQAYAVTALPVTTMPGEPANEIPVAQAVGPVKQHVTMV